MIKNHKILKMVYIFLAAMVLSGIILIFARTTIAQGGPSMNPNYSMYGYDVYGQALDYTGKPRPIQYDYEGKPHAAIEYEEEEPDRGFF